MSAIGLEVEERLVVVILVLDRVLPLAVLVTPREQEGDHDVDHEDPAVDDPHDARGFAQLLDRGPLGRDVLEGECY